MNDLKNKISTCEESLALERRREHLALIKLGLAVSVAGGAGLKDDTPDRAAALAEEIAELERSHEKFIKDKKKLEDLRKEDRSLAAELKGLVKREDGAYRELGCSAWKAYRSGKVSGDVLDEIFADLKAADERLRTTEDSLLQFRQKNLRETSPRSGASQIRILERGARSLFSRGRSLVLREKKRSIQGTMEQFFIKAGRALADGDTLGLFKDAALFPDFHESLTFYESLTKEQGRVKAVRNSLAKKISVLEKSVKTLSDGDRSFTRTLEEKRKILDETHAKLGELWYAADVDTPADLAEPRAEMDAARTRIEVLTKELEILSGRLELSVMESRRTEKLRRIHKMEKSLKEKRAALAVIKKELTKLEKDIKFKMAELPAEDAAPEPPVSEER